MIPSFSAEAGSFAQVDAAQQESENGFSEERRKALIDEINDQHAAHADLMTQCNRLFRTTERAAHLEDQKEAVRTSIIQRMQEGAGRLILDEYDKFSLPFIPLAGTQDTGSVIKCFEESPRVEFAWKYRHLPVIGLVFDERVLNDKSIGRGGSAGGFNRVTLRRSNSCGEVLQYLLVSGTTGPQDCTRVHECAHNGNTYGSDYSGKLSLREMLLLGLGLEPYEGEDTMFHLRRCIEETHSILSDKLLTELITVPKPPSRADQDVVDDLFEHLFPRYFQHDDVLRKEDLDEGMDMNDRYKIERRISSKDGSVEDEKPEIQKAYAAVRSTHRIIFRLLGMGLSLAEAGTFLGRLTKHKYIEQDEDGNFFRIERRVVAMARRKGIVPRKSSLQESLGVLDARAEIAALEFLRATQETKVTARQEVVRSLSSFTEDRQADTIRAAEQGIAA